jgi:hypothetical protein
VRTFLNQKDLDTPGRKLSQHHSINDPPKDICESRVMPSRVHCTFGGNAAILSFGAAIPAARIKVLCDPIISALPQLIGHLFPAFATLFLGRATQRLD